MSEFLSIILLFLPLVSVTLLILKRKHEVKTWILFLAITSALFYLVMMLSVKEARIEGDKNIARYDLDGDGSYSQEELTPEAKAALDDWASDTGLNLAPITGLFIAPIYSGFWHLIVGTPYLLIERRRSNNNKGEQGAAHNP